MAKRKAGKTDTAAMMSSVIITTYNRPHYLCRTIEGYLRQTQLPAEIIIADDGSAKEAGLLISRFEQTSPVRITHVWQEDKGFRAARIRNKAIARAAGQYIILADDDAIPLPTLVKDHLKYAESGYFLQGHRVLLGPSLSQGFAPEDNSVFKLFKYALRGELQNFWNGFVLPWPVIRKSRSMMGIRSCNMSFFKEDLISVNGFNEDFTGWGKEDSELVVRLYKYGLKRKDIRFRGSCCHLYHEEYSRDRVERNIALLQASQREGGYFCKNGLNQHL